MVSCCIKWCGKTSANSNSKINGITFHRFPNDNAAMKEKWINASKRENWFPSKTSVVCSRHFTKDCFYYMKNRRRLLSSAVPTLFLPILTEGSNSKCKLSASSLNSSDTEELKVVASWTPEPIKRKRLTESPSTSSGLDPESTTTRNTTNKRLSRRIIELSTKIVQKNIQIKKMNEKNSYFRRKIIFLERKVKELEGRLSHKSEV